MQAKEVERKHVEAVTEEKIEALAYDKGYTFDAAKEILLRDARIAAGTELTQRQQQAEINRLKKETLRNDKYFRFVEPQLDNLVKQDPNVDINGAYTYLIGEYMRSGKMDELIEAEKSKTQKRTVAEMQDRNRRRSMSGGDAGGSESNAGAYLSKEHIELANAWGIDKRELAAHRKTQENKKRR
jgi:hypothetical protein